MKHPFRTFAAIMIILAVSSCVKENAWYVSPDGDDANPGTISQPWKTLNYAVKTAAEARGDAEGAIRIVLKGGEYPMVETVVIDGIDNISIAAAKGETPVLLGEVPLTGWVKAVDADLPEDVRALLTDEDCIWLTDLSKSGITDFGNVVGNDNRMDIYYNGKRFHPARWPNEGNTISGKALGKTPTGPNYANYLGSLEGIFEYKDERMDRWAAEKDAYMHGYWFWDWSEDYNKVESIDPVKRSITLAAPYHYYGYRDGFRFYGLNLLCELDMEGEYYIDREKGLLYVYAPSGFDPEGSQFTASVFNKENMLSVSNSKDFSVTGLTFRGGREGAIAVTGCRNILIKDCVIEQFGRNLMIWKDGKDYLMDGCLLREMGHGGLLAIGGDRKTLEPSGYRITNTIFKDISLYKPTYQPAIACSGVGVLIDHNWFGNCASSALRFDGNDMVVEYNHFENLVTESDDQGGIDTWFDITYRGNIVRYNWWQDITGATREGAAGVRLDDIISGYKIYGNVFVNCGGGHFGAVQIHGGKDNYVENNLMYGCLKTLNASTWSDKTFENKYNEDFHLKKMEDVDFPSELYKQRYPELANGESPFDNHNRNFVRNNLAVNPEVRLEEAEGYVLENNTELDSAKPLKYFLNPKVQKGYGLSPIPWKEMGLKDNKYKDAINN